MVRIILRNYYHLLQPSIWKMKNWKPQSINQSINQSIKAGANNIGDILESLK